jgi:sugar phosphate isomerase/epimerase
MAAGAVGWPAFSAPKSESQPQTGQGVVIYCRGLLEQAQKRRDPKANLFEPFTFLEHCRQLGAGGIQVPLGIREEAYARRLRQRAAECGMFIEGSLAAPAGAADLERFEAEIRTASLAGAAAVRTVVMPGRRYEQFESVQRFRQAARQARSSLELAAPVVARHGVRLAVENHKDFRTAEQIELLRRIGSPWVGACVDTGNNFTLLEDPVQVVEALAPWAFCVHLKDQAVGEYAEGFLYADVPLGQGFLDLPRMIAALGKAKPGIRFCLETITRDPLRVPCRAEKYWVAMGDVPRSELERTLRTVREHHAAKLPQLSALSPDEQVMREEANVRAGLAYARKRLGI